MTERRATIVDVARRAGVSKGLVSFALNGRPGVSAQTRERILAAAEELGWQPSQRARGLSVSRAFALGLVVARPAELLGADPFFPAFIAGVETVLSERGQALVLQVVTSPEAEVEGYSRLARDGRVDGVFLLDLREKDPRFALLEELGLPAVTLNRWPGESRFPAVCLDDRAGIGSAVRHLADLGHTRIAHVSGPHDFVHGAHRRGAWADALDELGLPRGPEVESDFSADGGTAATQRLLSRTDPPTAIVYANDLMAVAGMAVARERGLSVPEQVSMTGFDDSVLAQHVHPPLTTVRTDTFSWGRQTASTLLDLIEGDRPEDVQLPAAELVLRETTASAPASAARARTRSGKQQRPAGRRESRPRENR